MTKISPISFYEPDRNLRRTNTSKRYTAAFLSFNSASEGTGTSIEHTTSTEDIKSVDAITYSRYPQNSNDLYAKQFANYSNTQCLAYIKQNAALNRKNNPNIKDLDLGSKRALCAIIAKAQSLGVRVTINTAVRDYNTQNDWYHNPRFKGRATITSLDKLKICN